MQRMLLTLALLASIATASLAQGGLWQAPGGVREIAVPGLGDFRASMDQFGPVIYYDPIAAARVGPAVTAFFRAHEYAHVQLQHVTRDMFARDPYSQLWMRREFEKEADREAAKYFARRNPSVNDAAVRYFETSGNPGDSTHLPGPMRAELIRQAAAQERGGRAASEDEPRGRAQNATFSIEIDALAPGRYGAEVTVWIDGERVGRVSNLDGNDSFDVSRFRAGAHSYRLSARLYAFDPYGRPYPMTTVEGGGRINVEDGDTFKAEGRGQSARLVKVD